MNNSALQIRPSEQLNEWQIIREQSSVLIKSGFLPQSIKTPEQAMAIILTGRELGISTMVALNSINVIQGKPTVPPQLMLALINRTGQVEDMQIETGITGATCTIKRRGRAPYTATFGPAEAEAMGLSGKDNYKKQPATMYKWRAIADAARVTFPDVILGMYLPDEMGATVDYETGEMVKTQPETVRYIDTGAFRDAEPAEPAEEKQIAMFANEEEAANYFYAKGRKKGIAMMDLKQTWGSTQVGAMSWKDAIDSLDNV